MKKNFYFAPDAKELKLRLEAGFAASVGTPDLNPEEGEWE